MTSRRDFMKQVGGATLAALAPTQLVHSQTRTARIRVAYAAITWNEHDLQAIEDISALHYPGIQLRANVLTSFGDKPAELRRLLAGHGLTFVAFSSGDVDIDAADERGVIDEHVSHARWLREAGGLYLQIIGSRPRGRAIEPGDYAHLGHVLSEIGRRTAEIGIPVAYHPHVGSLGEAPHEIAQILDATDERYVRLLLDVAHWQQGGGDPVAAIHQYRHRLLTLHLKDVRPIQRADGTKSFQFVELGRGTVDLKGVFSALDAIGFEGWGIVELDSPTSPTRTPKESAAISERYLEDVIGLRVTH